MQAHCGPPLARAAARPRVTSSERAQTTRATSSSDGPSRPRRASRLRNDLISVSSSSSTHDDRSACSRPQSRASVCGALRRRRRRTRARRRARASRRRRGSRAPSAKRGTCGLAVDLLTERRAAPARRRAPPPVNCGARIVPWRARPVPFWRHGFARPPETSPRLFVAQCPRGGRSAPRARPRGRGAASPRRRRPPRRARRPSSRRPRRAAVPSGSHQLTSRDLDEPVLRARARRP